jgi:hypothetical protein
MKMSPEALLERARKRGRRVTRQELVDRGFAALENAGLEPDAIKRLADDTGIPVEDIAHDLATSLGFRAPLRHAPSHDDEVTKADIKNLKEKMDEIRELLVQQRDECLRKDWYSVDEVARLTGFRPYTIRQCCNTGRIEDDLKVKDLRTGKWRIKADAVQSIQNFGLPPSS